MGLLHLGELGRLRQRHDPAEGPQQASRVRRAGDETQQLLYAPTSDAFSLGLNVTRAWEAATGDDAGGLVLRITLHNTNASAVRVGGFGFSLVPDTTWGGLNLTGVAASLSFLDPHIGGGGGWVTWSRADGTWIRPRFHLLPCRALFVL